MARVESLCVSEQKGERKHPVQSAVFEAGHGIEGDAHAGPWHRQVSFLSAGDVDEMRSKGLPDLAAGDFAENVVISGLDLASLGLGSRLRLGAGAVVSITQLGKVCHAHCRIYEITGDCIMPRKGLFARVEAGGIVQPGDEVEVLETVPRERYQAIVLTISDRCSRREAVDTAGPAVARLLEEKLGANIYRAVVLPDERQEIADGLRHYCDGHSIDIVVTVGGTGFAPRDVTPEASRDIIERFTPGLDEAMRAASLLKTPHAVLSRGLSGIRGATLVVNLPGSLAAALENLSTIIPALAHGLDKLRGDSRDCGRRENVDG